MSFIAPPLSFPLKTFVSWRKRNVFTEERETWIQRLHLHDHSVPTIPSQIWTNDRVVHERSTDAFRILPLGIQNVARYDVVVVIWYFNMVCYDSRVDLNRRYGSLCKEEALWNHLVISVFSSRYIEAILKRSSRYPLRPPQEVISHYRRSRRDRYTNLGLVNEWVACCAAITRGNIEVKFKVASYNFGSYSRLTRYRTVASDGNRPASSLVLHVRRAVLST